MSARDSGKGSALQAGAPEGEAAHLLDLLVEQVVDYAIFVIDPRGCIATWNSGAQRIKGYTRDEIVGKPYAIFFSEEDQRAGKPQRILRTAEEEGRFHEEGWRVRKDGSLFFASVVVTALRDENGRLQGFAKITRDLTERLKAEAEARRLAEERAARRQAEIYEREMRRSRDELDLILKSIAEGVTVQSLDAGFAFVNDAAARLCGFASAEEMLATPREEILSRFEVFHEDGRPFSPGDFPGRQAFQGRSSTVVLRFRVKRTGEERWSVVSAAPVVDANGAIELAVSVFRDITETKRSEQAWQFLADASATLSESLDYKDTLKRLAQLAVPRIADWCSVEVLTPSGELEQLEVAHADAAKLEMAREWRRRWPPRPGSSSRRAAQTGVPELVPDITDAMIAAAAQDPEQREVARALGLRSAMVAPLVVDRKPFGVITFISAESGRRYEARDLIVATEIGRRASLAIENARAYEMSRTAVQVRDNFLSIASHELRTPLSALTILTTSLFRAADQGRLAQLGPTGLSERLQKADRQVRQLTRLVERLLDVSRLSSQDLLLEPELVDLGELAREVVSRLEDAAADRGVPIQIQVSGAVRGLWDRGRLDQAITNLVTNAIKYGGGTPVTVTVNASGPQRARLTVRDQGPGIPQEHQERVFGQFERAASESLPGMGLGLWLVRRIVTAHGGNVSLDSVQGQGASFTVVLPVGAG
jgi:PAS domain S-box-containing protein